MPILLALIAVAATADTRPPLSRDAALYRRTCDGSAAAPATRDLFVSANDEDNRLRVYRLRGGRPAAWPVDMTAHLGLKPGDEADIEGAATKQGITYWIGSHGRSRAGEERPARQRLFATRWNGHQPVAAGRARSDLLQALIATPGSVALGLRDALPKPPEGGGINIEGLADGPGDTLLIGFRSPLVGRDARALVIPLREAAGAIDAGASIRFGEAVLLDLGGRGVRDIARLPGGRYVVVAGPAGEGGGPFALYDWSGRAGDRPVLRGGVPAGMAPEAVIAHPDGGLMLFSDDGTDLCKVAPRPTRAFRGRRVAWP